jgi:hypothetical protein
MNAMLRANIVESEPDMPPRVRKSRGRGRHRLTDPLRYTLPYAQLARDPVHPHPGAAQLKNPPRHVVGRDWPTEALALSAGSFEPGTRPLDQH